MAFEFDQSYKLVSEEDPRGTVSRVVGIPLSPDAVVESIERELNMERLHADHLYRVKDRGKECIHHLEALAHYRAGWEAAQMDHAVYVALKYRLPVFSHLVVMQARGAPRVIPERLTRVYGGLRQTIRVNVIRLWRRPAQAVLDSDSMVLYPWTALMDATLEQQREAARRLRGTGHVNLLMQMTTLGGLRYGGKEAFIERIGRMLLTKDILRESPVWKEIEEEGRNDGLASGLVIGQRRTMRCILQARFGALPDWVDEKLGSASSETLDQWSERAGLAASLEAVFE